MDRKKLISLICLFVVSFSLIDALNLNDDCSSHKNGKCLKIEDCESYKGIRITNQINNKIWPEQQSQIKNYTCGYIRETNDVLYCCPPVDPVDDVAERSWTNNADDECVTTDHKPGICKKVESCHRMNGIIEKPKQDEYYFVRANRCRLNSIDIKNYFVCCAKDEILESNECYDAASKKGQCVHWSDCDSYVTLKDYYDTKQMNIPNDSKMFWVRSKCKPKTIQKQGVHICCANGESSAATPATRMSTKSLIKQDYVPTWTPAPTRRTKVIMTSSTQATTAERRDSETSNYRSESLLEKYGNVAKDTHEKCKNQNIKKYFNNRILGGDDAKLREHLWIVPIFYREKTSTVKSLQCGGTIISNRHVITAAHCMPNVKNVDTYVNLGDWNVQTSPDCDASGDCNPKEFQIKVHRWIPHPNYVKENNDNDIALLRLNSRITFKYGPEIDLKIKNLALAEPICLPIFSKQQEIKEGSSLEVVGWGQGENGILSDVKQKLGVDFIDRTKCAKVYSTRNIDESKICAGGEEGEDSCKGDSGGPLIAKARIVNENGAEEDFYYLAGIVSFGSKECGTKGKPGVYANVAHYIEWIFDTMNKNL